MEPYLKKQLFIAAIVYVGQILVGYGFGWSAPMIPKLQDPEETPLPEVVNDGQSSWIVSRGTLYNDYGPYVSSYLSNTRGRKTCLQLGGILTILAFLILALAQNLAMIIAGRIFTGLGTGIIFVINLVYLGEIASTNIRGILLTGTGIFTTFGTLIVYSVGPYVPYSATSYVGLFITVIYVTGLYFIPETPMFHILQGQQCEAKTTLFLLGRQDDIDILLSTKPDKDETQGQWKDLFRIRSNRKALFITFVLNILQQMSGIIAIIFFATTIFELAGSSIEPNIATIVIGITQLLAASITTFFVERGGRKVLLLASTASCCLSLAILGTYFLLDHLELAIVSSIQWLPLVTLIIVFLSYDLGFGIIPGTFIGEMFQSNVRSIGSAITITSAWLFGFGISTAFGYMISGIGGHFTFWIFSGACALAFLFTAIFVPETKGKSFSEIQAMLSK